MPSSFTRYVLLFFVLCVTTVPLTAAVSSAGSSINKTKNTLEYEARDGDWKIKIGGRFMLDAAKYFDDDPPSLESGIEVRRARLFISGTLKQYWDFKVEYDFVGTGKKKALDDGLKDAYIAYTGLKPVTITVGNMKEPFSLEELTSSNYYTFMERTLPNALSAGRNLGIRLNAYGEKWTASAGLFGGSLAQPVLDGHAVTGRVTFSPVHEKDRVVHLGLAGSWRSSNDDDVVRFRSRPESHITDIRLVDTKSFDTEDFFRVGVEAAVVKGPVSLQAEYLRVNVNREIPGNPDIDLDGYYVEASWFITGESRNYNFKGGNFKGIKPKASFGSNGAGAWQVASRFSSIDLSNNDIIGGKQDNFTLGLNWYPTTYTRLAFNYIKVLDVDGGSFDGTDPDIVQARAYIHW